MEALVVLALVFGLFWMLILRPQQRRLRAHQQLIATLEEGDEVVLTAGIFGRITELGPEQMQVEVAPGVELQVARQAVLRRVEQAIGDEADFAYEADDVDGLDDEIDNDAVTDNNADRPDGDRTTS